MIAARLYGLMAEFETPAELVRAAAAARAAGYQRFDAYSPCPVEGLSEAIGFRKTRLPLVTLLGGLAGGVIAFAFQYWSAAISYPLDVGGRPLNSWPAFLPITFEMTVLGAALATVIGMFALNGLPMPYHPVFNVERFALASRDRFFLCIEAADTRFDREETRAFLASQQPRHVMEVER